MTKRFMPILLSVCVCAAVSVLAGCPAKGPEDTLPNAHGKHLLRLVQISDTQIVDEESPARLVKFAPLTKSAWRPEEAYDVQTLDATLRVINEHQTVKGGDAFPIDFVIATGDQTDGCQHNELRWFIDTMDGKTVHTDSGDADGIDRDQVAEDNPKLPYAAEGLDASIPWYTVFGNHDGLSVGIFDIDRSAPDPEMWVAPVLRPLAALIGLHNLWPRENALSPTNDKSPAIIRASAEPADPGTLKLPIASLEAGEIVPDAARHFSSREQFIDEHFDTTSLPVGHGFSEENQQSGKPRYAVRPVAGAPVRLIVLDTVYPNPRRGLPAHYGVMTREQFDNFLKPAVDAARKAGEWVIVASHHPSEDFDLPYRAAKVGTAEFRKYLSDQPNLIAHICGHTHVNFVQKIDGANPYFEIQTGSIIDYPQEGRILDIYYLANKNAIRLKSTMISHMEDPTRLSAESYRRCVIDAANHGKSGDQDAQQLRQAISDAGIENWPSDEPSMTAKYGSDNDRDFDVTFVRGKW